MRSRQKQGNKRRGKPMPRDTAQTSRGFKRRKAAAAAFEAARDFPSLTNWQLTQWQRACKGKPETWPHPGEFALMLRPMKLFVVGVLENVFGYEARPHRESNA